MNGAETLVKTFLAGGLDTCFANPGTSEMHFVAALDKHPEMRCVLCLFEGGTTGAADGYYRMAGKPAATLLHLAPGFGNAYANAHNARKAGSGIVNVVGDHATYHLKYDSPLKGDVAGITGSVSHWVRSSPDAPSVAPDGAAALAAARAQNGQIATLVLPANTAWEDAKEAAPTQALPPLRRPSEAAIKATAKALSAPGAALLVAGCGLHGQGAELAGKIAAATGCRLMADLFIPRIDRGEGAVDFERLPYPVDGIVELLEGTRHLILLGAKRPIAFFAYPGKPSTPEPADCPITELCGPEMDIEWTLHALATELNADEAEPRRIERHIPEAPTGPLTVEAAGAIIAAHLPEGALLVDESITASRIISPLTRHAAKHTGLQTCGGAIGGCLPIATGAAIACPDVKTIALTGDGSAMYTLQSLWTMARENLDVLTIVFANRGYQILHGELQNVGVTAPGRNASTMFDIEEPLLDWVALAKGHGVAGEKVTTAEAFSEAFLKATATRGPYLIELSL